METFFKDVLQRVIKGAQQKEIDALLTDFRSKILTDTNITILGNPTRVKTLDKYLASPPRPGEMFSSINQGAPRPSKGGNQI